MRLGIHQPALDQEAAFRNWETLLNRPAGSIYDVGDSTRFNGCWDNYDMGINPAGHPNVNRQLVYNVGFFQDWAGCPGPWPTISKAAADIGGEYSAHWRQVAQDLVNKGYANARYYVASATTSA
jgi:hypothetical protein